MLGNFVGGRHDARSGCELMRLTGEECRCNGFDEQLRFGSEAGVPLSHIDYRVSLGDGELWQGTTDGEGHTGRIGSKAAATFDRVEFIARSEFGSCCSLTPVHEEADAPSAAVKILELTMYRPLNAMTVLLSGKSP